MTHPAAEPRGAPTGRDRSARRPWRGAAVAASALLGLLACASPSDPAPDDRPAPLPLPVIGGTLTRLDDDHIVAADPEGARLWVVDLSDGLSLVSTILLPPGSQPGRSVAGAPGELWVVLRGAGALARVQVSVGAVDLHPVCDAPRGLDRAPDGSLWLACVDGDLVNLSPLGVEIARTVVDTDLRDVVVVGDEVWVSRFRAAEVLVVSDGSVAARWTPPVTDQGHPAAAFEPDVAWRMIADPLGGGVLLAHQRAQPGPIDLSSSAAFGAPPYGGPGCDAVVQAGLTRFYADGRPPDTVGPLQKTVLPVDVTLRDDGVAVLVAAGAGGLSDVAAGFVDAALWGQTGVCTMLPGLSWSGVTGVAEGGGRVVAALSTAHGLVLQTQSPSSLQLAPFGGVTDTLSFDAAADRGVELMHLAPTASVACASCHPEGGEDGRAWSFEVDGARFVRRTQAIGGLDLQATAPLHWDGALADLPALLDDTYAQRMGGVVRAGDDQAVADLLARVRQPRAVVADALVADGQAVFEAAGCSSCHTGPSHTDNLNHDVGTTDDGAAVALQTPSLLGLWARGPWMHDGCAVTLEMRFDPTCGGAAHGQVDAADLPALIAYLRSL